MWIYSFLSSHLSNLLLGPIEAPPSLPAAPSASNPSPYQFPVLDPSSTEHNPLSYVETRPVGTYLKKKTLKMEQEEEEDYRRRLKEKRNPKRLGEDGANLPIVAPFKREVAPRPDATETPVRIVNGYLTSQVEMLCSESDWQLNQCLAGGSSLVPTRCEDEYARKANCRKFTRAFLISLGYGLAEKTPAQDILASRLADLAWQEKVVDGTATKVDELGLPGQV